MTVVLANIGCCQVTVDRLELNNYFRHLTCVEQNMGHCVNDHWVHCVLFDTNAHIVLFIFTNIFTIHFRKLHLSREGN